uniref:Uncharacterized protein n=1 Tax=Anopheles albimanus TaxID=7167 RepID=A0A182FY85_ANOAL
MDVAETEHGDKRKTVNQVNSKCNSERDEAATMAYHIEQPDSLGAYDCPWKVAHREPTGQRRYQYKPCWRKASQGFAEERRKIQNCLPPLTVHEACSSCTH